MILRSILFAGTAALLGAAPAWAQNATLTENINNTGIPRNAPSLGLSNIYGLNPCSSGVSVGVSTPLFGVGGASATIDKECETRNNAAVVVTGLKDETLAREILCSIKDIREAAARIGKPCLQDQPAARVSNVAPDDSAPKAAATPPPAAAQPVAAAQALRPVAASLVIRADAPAFCRVKDLDVSLYAECTTAQAPLVPETAVTKRPTPATAPKESVPARRRVTPVPVDQQKPDTRGDEALKNNPGWVEAISYTQVHASGEKPAARLTAKATTIPSAPIPAVAQPLSGKLERLLVRGAAMMAAGDIVEARLLFERAAAAGSAEAAAEMGKTYDPVFLARMQDVGTEADPVKAKLWYRMAIALGDANAASLLQIASR
jgi:hypothetical protein